VQQATQAQPGRNTQRARPLNLQTFTAESMPAALAMVKRKLGPAAVILHTRTYRRGGVLGFGAKQIVEVTAGVGPTVGHPGHPGQTRPPGLSGRNAARLAQPVRPAAPSPVITPTAGDLIRRTYAAAQAELRSRQTPVAMHPPAATPNPVISRTAKPAPAPPTMPSATMPSAITPSAITPMPHDQLAAELAEVKRMVSRVMQKQTAATAADLPQPLFDHYRALLEQEVAEELADEIVANVRQSLGDEKLTDPAAVRAALRRELIRLIPAADKPTAVKSADKSPDTPEDTPEDKRPRTIALIGPTGVGKTTTVAKLAAQFKLREKKRVGLVTLDTYRIAAVEQLRTYAEIIGVPLKVAADAPSLCQALRDLRDCDVILIDTAGRSQRDDGRLEQLRTLLDAADPHEVHLVLASTCTRSAINQAIEKFAAIRADKIILTKLDEAVSFGVVLNVARQVDKQFSYVTTGQEVPHDIEATQADRLAALLMGEEAKTC
jgi:flagellar biosynthesis protein FlhF